jgi:hypothetical protein
MSDRDGKPDDLLGKAMAEVAGMAKQGFGHPTTKPVQTGAAVGAVAGALLPLVSLPLGLVAGAGIAFWYRLNR